MVILAGSVVGGERKATTDPRGDLARRLADAPDPARFALTYRRGGTRVLDCVLANTSFSAEVDRSRVRMLVRTEGSEDQPTILVADGAVFLHRSLFTDPPFASAWLQATRPAGESAGDILRRVLGPDLAGDVARERLPASGHAIAAEALAVAASVERAGAGTIAGESAERFRLEVDPQRFADAATVPGAAPPGQEEPTPVFDVWVNGESRVVRVVVSAKRRDGTPAPPEEGWTVDYRPLAEPPFAIPPPSEVTDWSSVDTSRLMPAARECRLPS